MSSNKITLAASVGVFVVWRMKCQILSLLLVLFQTLECQGWCIGLGRNPTFVAVPRVLQRDVSSVQISWNNIVKDLECADNFLVSYWIKGQPNNYKLTDFLDAKAMGVTIGGLKPNVPYLFQVIAREDKGAILGIDYNRSPKVPFMLRRKPAAEEPASETQSEAVTEAPGVDEPSLGDIAHRIDEEEASEKDHLIFVIVGSVFAALFVILILAGVAYQMYKKHRQNSDENEATTKYDKMKDNCAIVDSDFE